MHSIVGLISDAAVFVLVPGYRAVVAERATASVSAALSTRESLAIGALLQCKGLMEIVAATILRAEGFISERAFAVLVTLAVVSTLLTGPLFHFIARRGELRSPPLTR